jgi:hypothetical protein
MLSRCMQDCAAYRDIARIAEAKRYEEGQTMGLSEPCVDSQLKNDFSETYARAEFTVAPRSYAN